MVMERYFPGTIAENGYSENEIMKSEKAINDKDEGNNSSESIDCNICLDLVKDPVVTFCGHLYCWPCIYKWIRFQTESSDQRTSHCPVCKAAISQETMIPLYVNGLSTEPSKEGKALDIPHRPSSPRPDIFQRMAGSTATRTGIRESPGRYVAPPQGFSGGGGGGGDQIGMTMFGEMVYARIFGNSQTTIYAYPNSYNIVSTNPRIRRHLMEADKSLSRLIFFLMCCMFLCLLLF